MLLTGASGFIGARLSEVLREADAKVWGVSRQPQEEGAGCDRWFQGDVTELSAVRAAFAAAEPDVIFHLAGQVTGTRDLKAVVPTLRGNLLSAVNLMSVATERGCERLVLAGSLEEPEGTSVPASPYAAAKGAVGQYAQMFHALYGTPVTLARIFMVYGPGDRNVHRLVPYVSTSLLRGETPKLTSGVREVDWVYVDDVVRGLVALARVPASGQRLDLGSGQLVMVRRVAEELVSLTGSATRPHYGAIADRAMEQVRRADVAATFDATGWKPTVPLREGLARTVSWYRAFLETQSGT